MTRSKMKQPDSQLIQQNSFPKTIYIKKLDGRSCTNDDKSIKLPSFMRFLYPATKVWRGIMLYPSVSVRPSVRPSVLTISDR